MHRKGNSKPCPHQRAWWSGTTSCLNFLSLLKQCYQLIASCPPLPFPPCVLEQVMGTAFARRALPASGDRALDCPRHSPRKKEGKMMAGWLRSTMNGHVYISQKQKLKLKCFLCFPLTSTVLTLGVQVGHL